MVSPLWKAASEGSLTDLDDLLTNATVVDIEVKDHTGATPLIEAVKNGHVDVVSLLLEKGADPNNASSHGPPQQYTSDPAILELLTAAQAKVASQNAYQENGYTEDANGDAAKAPYYPSSYPYYPTLNSAPPMPEGTAYYPPPPPPPSTADGMIPGGPGNLPPPDIARFIPCRYFPACRYGSSCMFLHPQAPYYQGPVSSPGQYPAPYDPMAQQPYQPNYYSLPPPSFQPPNGVPVNTPPTMNQSHSPSDMGPVPAHFSPNGAPPPLPYGPMSPMMSPSAYPHPGQLPVPMSIPPLPPLQHPLPPAPVGQSPHTVYPALPPAHPFAMRPDGTPFPPPPAGPVHFPDVNGSAKSPSLNPQPDSYGPSPARESFGHQRRGSARRGSFAGRKPPCLFFPSGRCKNGDECRFPHVLPDASQYFSSSRGGGPRPRGGHGANGFATIDEKLAGLSIRDDQAPRYQNGESSSKSQSDAGSRPKYSQGYKNGTNGFQNNKRVFQQIKQRLPSADDFPVLAGSTTPPVRSPSNGSLSTGVAGPTAAQVLQAPAPVRRDGTKEASRNVTPDPVHPAKDSDSSLTETSESPLVPATKLPISFAAVMAAPDVAKEVPVSA
ncbi:hypothetical protein EV421DRAFT_18217 [Armillaria borealis]|uniref:C3H1-type domain-containing protein n=1 Tax=Armillaria borealis TaxID=47425 RepID=A0AA39K9L5_9AGAR|nr:hypothetical protein EV421DRAFT_18217 [Armillaria borealis]